MVHYRIDYLELMLQTICDLFSDSAPKESRLTYLNQMLTEMLGDYFKGKRNLPRNVHVMIERILE